MNKKTIKSIIKNKFNRWVESIKDEEVKKLVRKNTIITGGCITSMLLNEEVKDFDIYFKDKETVLAVATYYVDQFNKKHNRNTSQRSKAYVVTADGMQNLGPDSWISEEARKCAEDRVKIFVKSLGVASEDPEITKEPFEDVYDVLSDADTLPGDTLNDEGEGSEPEQYRPVFLSSNAITLSGKIQLIIRFYGDPEVIHENYDFVHCTNYWTSQDNELVLRKEALESILAKELRYMGSKYPICSIIRTRKFINRGWFINAGQYLKMCFQVSKLDLENIEVLEDQLVGVDSSYFIQLIKALKKKKEKNEDFSVSDSYVATIIDKIF